MKLTKHLLALLLCAAMLLCLAGCHTSPDVTEPTQPPETTQPPEPMAEELYAEAVEKLQSMQYVEMRVQLTQTLTVGSVSYSKTREQTALWENWNKDSMKAKLKEKVQIDEQITNYSVVYKEGNAYTVVDNCAFVSEMTAQDFTAMYLPTVPLNGELYGSVTAQTTENGTELSFDMPSALESWAASEYAQLISASGSAVLDQEGTLTDVTYQAKFLQSGATVDLSVLVEISNPKTLNFTLDIPDVDGRYVSIDTPEVIYLLTDAYGHLAQSTTLTTTLTQTIHSEALATSAAFTTALTAGEWDGDLAMHYTQIGSFEYYDDSYYGYERTEKYQDGTFTTEAYHYDSYGDEQSAEEVKEYTREEVQTYIQDILTGAFPQYLSDIEGADVTDFGEIVLLELDCSNLLAQGYSHYICQYLTDDANILGSLSSVYKTTAMDYYVAVNRSTGLPTASGINFSGSHTIDGVPYTLSYKTAQSFYVADPGAYEAASGKTIPEEKPETPVTPLFYHVTGTDGGEMWLLGTIHAGDAHTAYLPEEIYTALDSSNALAVEFDDENFLALLEEDPALLTRVLSSYIYLDGTTTLDHLDPLVYAAGMSLLKAYGTDQTQAMLMKPYVWGQMIDGFYQEQSYSLSSEKGVDARLMDYARTHEIEIRNVESGIAQMEMLGGFSDAIQENMLSGSLAQTPSTYYAGVIELYRMWCAGDEAALTEYLASEPEGMSKQELALYQEYNKAMMTDRNAQMLEVAKEYLSGEDVVFYAVGLAHLLGDDGLVNTLRQAGYTVERVTYD